MHCLIRRAQRVDLPPRTPVVRGLGESGRGPSGQAPPHSKTCRKCARLTNTAKRLGVQLPSAAFEYPIASETFKRTHNEIRALLCCFVVILLVGLGSRFACAATIVESDVCIYGGTSGGAIAAVQSTRMGKTVSLAVFSTHLGGMTSGGLGQTDVGNTASIGGVSREFYRRIGQRYGMTERFTFEPHVARSVFDDWLAEVGVTPRWQQRLASVTKSGQRITEIKMEDGTIYRAKMFIDAKYEGDLMGMAGG